MSCPPVPACTPCCPQGHTVLFASGATRLLPEPSEALLLLRTPAFPQSGLWLPTWGPSGQLLGMEDRPVREPGELGDPRAGRRCLGLAQLWAAPAGTG